MVGPEKQAGEQPTPQAVSRGSGAPGTGRGIIREVDLDSIDLTPINARRTMERDFVEELGESIQKRGLISRPIVRPHPTSPGRYETVGCVDTLDDVPLLTVTSHDVPGLVPAPPSPAYLRSIAAGLREAHGWDDARIASYLAAATGARGAWTTTTALAALRDGAG